MKNIIKKYENIEKEFFEIDEENKVAKVKLYFAAAPDVFDLSYETKKPVLSDDFFDWVKTAFDIIPRKYKIDLDVRFGDLCGYDAEELKKIFTDNIFLEYKTQANERRTRRNIAYGLIGIGTVMLVGMILINALWNAENIFKTIFSYVADIAATVTYWEALNILVVEDKENRSYVTGLVKRFGGIKFSAESTKNRDSDGDSANGESVE